MADINVFELTNKELRKSESAQSTSATKKTKKTMKESVCQTVQRVPKSRKPFSIPASKLKFESLRNFLEADDSEVTVDYTPEDDVVLVIDPEMEEVPEDVEAAEDAAEDMIGNHVCKCSICGANYVTDAEISEEFEIEDETCPVCGETGDQIVVGVITPTEELSDEDADEIDNVDVDVDVEDEDGFEEDEVDVEEDEDFEEAVKRSKMRTSMRRVESKKRVPTRTSRRVGRVAESKRVIARKASATESKKSNTPFKFDDRTFNRMLTKFAKENYSNVRAIRISKGTVVGGKLTLEGFVHTTKGSKHPITFTCTEFTPSARMSIKFSENGPFTESVENRKETFVVECTMRNNIITPKTLRYSFKAKNAGIKESKDTFKVSGTVLSESAPTASKYIRPSKIRKESKGVSKRISRQRRSRK